MMPTTHPASETSAGMPTTGPSVRPSRTRTVVTSPATKEAAVAPEPYRRSTPMRFPGSRLTIKAPTSPNNANAI
jgi:hypothetical protein